MVGDGCPGYIGDAEMVGSNICIEGIKVTDETVSSYCEACREDLLQDMQSLLSLQQGYKEWHSRLSWWSLYGPWKD